MKNLSSRQLFERLEYLKDVSEIINKVYYLFDNASITDLSEETMNEALDKIFVEYKSITLQQIDAANAVKDLLITLEILEKHDKLHKRRK